MSPLDGNNTSYHRDKKITIWPKQKKLSFSSSHQMERESSCSQCCLLLLSKGSSFYKHPQNSSITSLKSIDIFLPLLNYGFSDLGNNRDLKLCSATEFGHPAMKIQVTNIPDNITIPYSLLLVRGKIINIGKSCKQQISLHLQSSNNVTNWPIVGREFMCYVQLKAGCNILIFTYDNSKLQIRVNYKKTNCDKFILPVYIVCRLDDGKFQSPKNIENTAESACRRIELAAKMLQLFIAESLFGEGFKRKTFNLPIDEKCLIFHSKLTRQQAQAKTSNELWKHYATELRESGLMSEKCKFLAFMSFTEYQNNSNQPPIDHKHMLQMTKGYSALGGGGLALLGTGSLYTWPQTVDEIIPCFTNGSSVDSLSLMDDSCNRGTYWACYTTSLGATLHEVGHSLNLVHNKNGIMARGFDDINKFFVLSQMISGEMKNKNAKSQFSLDWNSSCVEFGEAVWCQSSAVILSNHKWLNEFNEENKGLQINGLSVSSQHPLCLVELRSMEKCTLYFWECQPEVYIFEIKLNNLRFLVDNHKKIIIFALDKVGNIVENEIIINL